MNKVLLWMCLVSVVTFSSALKCFDEFYDIEHIGNTKHYFRPANIIECTKETAVNKADVKNAKKLILKCFQYETNGIDSYIYEKGCVAFTKEIKDQCKTFLGINVEKLGLCVEDYCNQEYIAHTCFDSYDAPDETNEIEELRSIDTPRSVFQEFEELSPPKPKNIGDVYEAERMNEEVTTNNSPKNMYGIIKSSIAKADPVVEPMDGGATHNMYYMSLIISNLIFMYVL